MRWGCRVSLSSAGALCRADGSCDWGCVYDPNHPMPKGASLDATGRIRAAPFTPDGGQALYYAG
jgi:hypothetical protein